MEVNATSASAAKAFTLYIDAMHLYDNGAGFRQIGRQMRVDHVAVMNWVSVYRDQLPTTPLPAEQPLHIVAMDELFHLRREEKTGFISLR